MRKSKFTEEQIVQTIRLAEAGTPVAELCRKIGISEQTFYTIKDAKEKLEAWRKTTTRTVPPARWGN